ncbi:MAG: hypothetical protein H6619_02290 [Deltaproteobacteria bacterium]|nr:hypothetical protein [Deltaproteobacteria bacterium]
MTQYSLSYLEESIKQAALKLWPEINHEPHFYPLLDLNLGDVCCDYCIELSTLLKRSPKTLQRELVQNLPEDFPFCLCMHDGYLNYRYHLNEGNFSEFLSGLDGFQPQAEIYDALILTPPVKNCFGLSYLRLAARAIYHFSLLRSSGSQVKFFLGNTLLEVDSSQVFDQNLFMNLSKLAFGEPITQAEAVDQVVECLASGKFDKSFICSSGQILEHNLFENLKSEYNTKLRFPKNFWLNTDTATLRDAEKLVQTLNTKDLFFHLLLPYHGQDLSFDAIGLKCRDNLPWYFASSLERLKRFSSKQSIAEAEMINFEQLEPNFLQLLKRLCFMKSLVEELRRNGEVESFVEIVLELLDQINRMVNNPSFRQSVERRDLSYFEELLLTRSICTLEHLAPFFSLDNTRF